MKERDKYDEKEMFRVPDSYFEDLTAGLMQKVDEVQEVRKPGFLAIAKPHLMLAASMVLLVIVSYTTLRFILPGFKKSDSEINTEEVYEYLALEMDETSLRESIDLLNIEDYTDDITASLSEEEIIDYLANQDINYELLLENF